MILHRFGIGVLCRMLSIVALATIAPRVGAGDGRPNVGVGGGESARRGDAIPRVSAAATAAVESAATRGPIGPWVRQLPWLNTPGVSEKDLDGRVVLVEFWAFECINCQRTTPAMRELSRDYRDRGLVMLGVHTPELTPERDHALLAREVGRQGIVWPVAMDDDYVAWRAFDNHAWPALYLIDRRGRVRATHIGELHVGTPAWTDLRHRIDALLAARTGTAD
jgi:thiol-disulfide isomerase/thioredoxin